MLGNEDVHFFTTVFSGLSAEDLEALFQLAEPRVLAAGEVYIREGAIAPKMAYVRSGLLRVWCRKPNDEEVTLMLRWENQFVAAIETITHRRPSRYVYQALEDTVLVEIDYNTAMAVIDQSPGLSAVRSSLLLHMLATATARVETFVMLSPEQRYLKMVEEKPDLNNRVADKHLATMLGITPVSLSRIRRRMARVAGNRG